MPRINAILPPRFRAEVADGELAFFVDGQLDMTSSVLHIVDDDTRSLSERLETATSSILSAIQDAISELESVPWPPGDGRDMALAAARLREGRLLLWYGDEAAPIVALRPIDLRELDEA